MLKIGHRGAKAHVAENTLASFQQALTLGADGIELDVHVCATGELVAIHDFTVDRTTNGTGEVHKLTLEELKHLKVEGSYIIPTLDEVMEVIGKKCLVNIEMKGRHTAGSVSDFVNMYVREKGYSYTDFIVSSFQREELKIMSQLNPYVRLGILTQASVTQAWEWAEEFSAKAIHPHYTLLTKNNVNKAREAGFKVYTWTVNEQSDIERVKGFGVDGIISDYPERL
ncbi:glycerophosphodiester phosphodiesterase [Flavobacterium cyanobacteriorum]|uniref:Glycerophosphodiester phosphodiesterase n=1 Tax=Flavobacterium cyanobacteriorum TaxID=2022802 RepID=A0A256A153_9FLAO|nr:glycerophosphodiester phosphodiesterase family protein [Flavobacterium cyanobacteriorum]OYQ47453.1 glycerophosphodiester phosphodiesterase [Flavobacterium cyanobacteriorum]